MFTEQKALVEDPERQCREAREAWIKLQALHQGAATQADRSAKELQEDRACVPDADLREAVAQRRGGARDKRGAEYGRRGSVQPGESRSDRLTAGGGAAAARHTQEDLDRLRKAASDMEIELRALGQQGLGEDLAAAQGELDQARKRFEAVEREAKAIKFLYETLREAEREAKDAFLGPVRKRVQPYLDLLFPGAELELGQDTLDIRHYVAANWTSRSIASALARKSNWRFSPALRSPISCGEGPAGGRHPDDALAYSDCNRFDRMQLVLRKASKNLQVIVLTCRERDYIGRGLPIVRLAECRTPETVA